MNVVLQIFSPLITSQRIMTNHFSNAYSAIKCYDGLSIIFDEVRMGIHLKLLLIITILIIIYFPVYGVFICLYWL